MPGIADNFNRQDDTTAIVSSCPRKVLVVGGGKMGGAIVGGWIAASEGPAASLDASCFTVVNPGAERRAYLQEAYGVRCVADVSDVAGEPVPDMVVLAVKPQVMGDVLAHAAETGAFVSSDGSGEAPLFVSIAAGLTCERLAAQLPANARLVRVMPNMPLLVGQGASGVCGAIGTPQADVQLVADLFGSLGAAVVVPEESMDGVCALSGSGPAYVALLIEELRDAAVEQGLTAEMAEKLAVQTVLGTASLIDQTGMSPAQARESICSPGGTTLAALDALADADFAGAVHAAVAAAARRSKELSQC